MFSRKKESRKTFHDLSNDEIFAVLRETVGANRGKPPSKEHVNLVLEAMDTGDLKWGMDLDSRE